MRTRSLRVVAAHDGKTVSRLDPKPRNAPAVCRIRATNSPQVKVGPPETGTSAGLAGKCRSTRSSSARIVVMNRNHPRGTPHAALHEILMLKKTEHQGDAL